MTMPTNNRSPRSKQICGFLLAMTMMFIPMLGCASEEDPDADLLVSVLSRMTILVKDVDVSKHFYSYALGYEVLLDKDISRPAVLAQMGLGAERKVRFAILKSSHVIEGIAREGAGLGLIQVSNPAPPVMSRPQGAILAIGEPMMAMRTSDIEVVYRRLKEIDAHIIIEPITSDDGSETELVVHDPDGIRIHVVQRPDREGK